MLRNKYEMSTQLKAYYFNFQPKNNKANIREQYLVSLHWAIFNA